MRRSATEYANPRRASRDGRGGEVSRPTGFVLQDKVPISTNQPAASIGREFAVALEVPVGEEKAKVVQSLVNDLKAIAGVLVALPPRSLPDVEPESDETLQ